MTSLCPEKSSNTTKLTRFSMPKLKIRAQKRSSFESQEKLKKINYRKESDTKILLDWRWLVQSFLFVCLVHFMHFHSCLTRFLKGIINHSFVDLFSVSLAINSLQIFSSFSFVSSTSRREWQVYETRDVSCIFQKICNKNEGNSRNVCRVINETKHCLKLNMNSNFASISSPQLTIKYKQ